MKLFSFFINSNIFISLAAVFLAIETQIQLGLKPQWHPYLFIIFFATLLEYNFHRIIALFTNKEALEHERHVWVKNKSVLFYSLVIFSILGFLISLFLATNQVLMVLLPLGLLTIFYSPPVSKKSKFIFRLRQIPFLKIFLIAFIWSTSTILLPIIQTNHLYDTKDVILMIVERFLFVFAITIPFDIRDIMDDKQVGLKTIPVIIGVKKSLLIANSLVILFIIICIGHYYATHLYYVLPGLLISGISTLFFINSKNLQKTVYYHYGILDGTMLLQGILVILSFYYFTLL